MHAACAPRCPTAAGVEPLPTRQPAPPPPPPLRRAATPSRSTWTPRRWWTSCPPTRWRRRCPRCSGAVPKGQLTNTHTHTHAAQCCLCPVCMRHKGRTVWFEAGCSLGEQGIGPGPSARSRLVASWPGTLCFVRGRMACRCMPTWQSPGQAHQARQHRVDIARAGQCSTRKPGHAEPDGGWRLPVPSAPVARLL